MSLSPLLFFGAHQHSFFSFPHALFVVWFQMKGQSRKYCLTLVCIGVMVLDEVKGRKGERGEKRGTFWIRVVSPLSLSNCLSLILSPSLSLWLSLVSLPT